MNHSTRSGHIIGIYFRFSITKRDIFSIFYTKKVCCVFSLESPHRGDSNEHTQQTISNMQKNISLNYPKSAAI